MAFLRVHIMSALPPKADIGRACRDVRFVPKADISEWTSLCVQAYCVPKQMKFLHNRRPYESRLATFLSRLLSET